jgi:hypothetical protein
MGKPAHPPAHLRDFLLSVAAWIVSLSAGAYVVDWSFAARPLAILVPFVVLGWLALVIVMFVNAVRACRHASWRRRLLVASAFPILFIFQPFLLTIALGPPSDVSLGFEFRHRRAEFDSLSETFAAEARGSSDSPSAAAVSPSSDPRLAPLLSTLRVSVVRRRAPGWIELVRYSRSNSLHGIEAGFLFTDVPPPSVVESFDVRPLGPRVYRRLADRWYLFRGAW